ncbi:MAG: hypothetical protein KKG96_03985, partial [Proteobacteria bacterium]|nr:hypothetical protein [Pseudomonadota bacterium]
MELGRELLRLLNNMASFYPVRLAQFLTGGNTRDSAIVENVFFMEATMRSFRYVWMVLAILVLFNMSAASAEKKELMA